jgi:hypothetical protein
MQHNGGKYEEIGGEIGRLVDKKQMAYGRSFDRSGEIFRILYPHGIRPEQYDDLLGMVRIIDKLFRIATARDALGESPWTDIAGYALLMNSDYPMDDLRFMSSQTEPGKFIMKEASKP